MIRRPLSLLLLIATAVAAQTPPRDESTVVLDANAVENLGVETAEAAEVSFESTVLIPGAIEHTCESHSVLSSRIAGRVVEVLVHQGDFTTKGEVIARIESRQPGDPPPIIDLIAPGSGLIVRSDVHLGAPVEPGVELLEILDLTTVWAVAQVPQHLGPLLVDGLTARVRIPALGGEPRESSFLRLGIEADPAAGTIEGVFELPNPGNLLRPGMRTEITLATQRREGVLGIPRDALQGDPSNRYVFIKDYELENAFVRTPVTVGELTSDLVEITAGLFPGDEVVTRGAYALAFAGKGNTSLKEALDAAHGHPHNEDGTEMSAEQLAAAEASGGGHGHSHDHGGGPLNRFLAIACVVLFLLLIASSLSGRFRQSSANS